MPMLNYDPTLAQARDRVRAIPPGPYRVVSTATSVWLVDGDGNHWFRLVSPTPEMEEVLDACAACLNVVLAQVGMSAPADADGPLRAALARIQALAAAPGGTTEGSTLRAALAAIALHAQAALDRVAVEDMP